MATPGIPFARWAADKSYLLIGPGVESVGFKLDDPETDLTATAVLALQAGTNRFVVTSVTGGTGDVIGPAGASDNALARFDGATGKVLQGSVVLLDDAGGLSGVTSINGGAVPPGGIGDVVGPGSATNNAIATYSGASGKLIQNSAITVIGGAISGVTSINGSAPGNGDVVGPGSATDSAIATFDGATGKLIQNSAVLVGAGGAVTGVTTINGAAPGNVVGPGAATNNAIATYSGATGKLIQNSAVTIGGGAIAGVTSINGSAVPAVLGDVVGPAAATSTAVALYNGATGKLIQNSVVLVSAGGAITGVASINGSAPGNVVGPGSATNNAIATYSGASGKVIQNSAVTISGGALAGVVSINGTAVPATLGDVVGPAGATNTAIATYNGATGKIIQNSAVTVSAGGAVAGVASLNGSAIPATIGDVVGPAAATSTAVALYNGATGKLLQNSVVTISAGGAIAGVSTLNGATPGNVVGPGSATNTAIALYSGATGKVIQNSVVTVSAGGAIAGVSTLNGAVPGNVVGPGGSTNNAIATYNGATGRLIQNSTVTVLAGAIAGVTTINGAALPASFGDVVGPGSATDNAVARYDGTSGKIIQNSSATLDDSGFLTLTGGIIFPNATALDSTGLANWQYGTAAMTFSGPWLANQNNFFRYERTGNSVRMFLINSLSAVANGVSAPITSTTLLPAAIRPSSARRGLLTVIDAGVSQAGSWEVSSVGTVSIFPTIGATGSFVAPSLQNAGVLGGQTFTYILG